jgi:hypothetical protein
MLPTPDDVAAGFRTRWDAAAGLKAIIPLERVFAGRVAEKAAWPNARILVREESRELTSGPLTLIKYRVTAEALVITAATSTSVRQQLDVAFSGSSDTPNAGLTVANGTVVHSYLQPGGGSKPTGERRDGEDVVLVTAIYLVLVEAQR